MHFSSTNFLSCTQLTLLDQILPIPLCCHINYLENEGKKKSQIIPTATEAQVKR